MEYLAHTAAKAQLVTEAPSERVPLHGLVSILCLDGVSSVISNERAVRYEVLAAPTAGFELRVKNGRTTYKLDMVQTSMP